MITLVGPLSSGIAAGGAGVATANANSPRPVIGELLAAAVVYNDAPPATTDVVIKTAGGDNANKLPPTQAILTLSNVTADAWFYPVPPVVDLVGAVVAGVKSRIVLHDFINVKIDQANPGDSVSVWLLIEA